MGSMTGECGARALLLGKEAHRVAHGAVHQGKGAAMLVGQERIIGLHRQVAELAF
jgi:hypothetical protein